MCKKYFYYEKGIGEKINPDKGEIGKSPNVTLQTAFQKTNNHHPHQHHQRVYSGKRRYNQGKYKRSAWNCMKYVKNLEENIHDKQDGECF